MTTIEELQAQLTEARYLLAELTDATEQGMPEWYYQSELIARIDDLFKKLDEEEAL